MFINETRIKSIEAEEVENCNFKVFSDRFCQNDEVGAAASLFCKNRPQLLKSLQKYLGSDKDHNTFEAEAVGVLLALWILENTAETMGKKVTLYLDNQSIIHLLRSPNTTAGQYLIQALLRATNNTSCILTI